MSDVPDEVQRWTAKSKAAVVLSIAKGETSAAEAARKHGPGRGHYKPEIASLSRFGRECHRCHCAHRSRVWRARRG